MLSTPWGQVKLILPVYQKSGIYDLLFNSVVDTIRAETLFKRMKNTKSLELFHESTPYYKALAIYKNLKKRIEHTKHNYSLCKSPVEIFHLNRRIKANNLAFFSRLGFLITADRKIKLKYPPEVLILNSVLKQYEDEDALFMPMNKWQGIVSANEWYRKGLFISILNTEIYPLYGVWTPTTQIYLGLLQEYLNSAKPTGVCVELGSGTGVISFAMAKHMEVFAIDNSPHAVKCTNLNAETLKLDVNCIEIDAETADIPYCDVLVCNPPWVPATVNSLMDEGVYDPNEKLLKAAFRQTSKLKLNAKFLLFYSDYASNLGLQDRGRIEELADLHGLKITGKLQKAFEMSLASHPLKDYKNASSVFLYELKRK